MWKTDNRPLSRERSWLVVGCFVYIVCWRALSMIMIISLGTLCFGMVLGWLTAYLVQRSRPGWREFKAALAVLSGAAVRSLFGGPAGLVMYGVGLVVGAGLYGATLLIKPLRHTHNIVLHPRR